MKKITIKEIAKEAGVSVGLASMVLNGKPGVSKKNTERVLNVMKSLNYTPNKAASTLRSGNKKMIGVITPDLSNHYFSEISRHIENIAYNNGYTVLFGSSDDRRDKIASLIDTFYADGIKGVLITPYEGCEPEISRAEKYGMKVVLMNRDLVNLEKTDNVGTVILDNNKAIRMAIDHFIENGYSKIEMITNDEKLSTLNVRMQSYLDIMDEKGLPSNVNLVDSNTEDNNLFYDIVQGIYERGSQAILVPRGYLALHISNVVKMLDLKIPEDLAIIGFDGGLNYRIMTPTLTQIVQDTRETAENSYNMLISMLENNTPASRIILEPSIESGDSTRKINK